MGGTAHEPPGQLTADQLTPSLRLQIIVAVAIGTFMGPLDSSVVNIALPAISGYFDVTIATVEWVVMSYLLIISSLLLTYGRLGDMYGHKRVYSGGFLVFTVGSLLCALSLSVGMLVFFRAVQAVGAGMMMSMGPAIVTDVAPPAERGKYMGIIAVAVSVALASGPVLGGLLVTRFGWQSIFYINIPIGIIGYVWAQRVIPLPKRLKEQQFDVAGAVLLFLALAAILFPLSYAEKVGWRDPLILTSLGAGAVVLAAFIYVEAHLPQPMVDLTVFRNRLFSAGNVSALLNFVAQYMVVFLMPFYLQDLRGMLASQAGILILPLPLTTLVVAPLAGYVSDKIDSRYLSSLGMGIMAVGMWQLSGLHANSTTHAIALAMVTMGLGSGLFQTPNNSAVMGSVPRNRLGIASSMLATMRNIGMVLGVAIAGALFTGQSAFLTETLRAAGVTGNALTQQVFVGALHYTYLAGAFVAFVAVFTSLVRGSLRNRG